MLEGRVGVRTGSKPAVLTCPAPRPLHRRERTSAGPIALSAVGQKATFWRAYAGQGSAFRIADFARRAEVLRMTGLQRALAQRALLHRVPSRPRQVDRFRCRL
jgi:hypothetical protein